MKKGIGVWVVLAVVLVVILAVLVGGWRWYTNPATKIRIVSRDPRVQVGYNLSDQKWQGFVRELGLFEKNGVVWIDDINGTRTNFQAKNVTVYFEPADLPKVSEESQGKPVISWARERQENSVVLKFRINYDLLEQEKRNEKMEEILEYQIAYRLTNLSASHFRVNNQANMQAQKQEMERLIDLEQTRPLSIELKQ